MMPAVSVAALRTRLTPAAPVPLAARRRRGGAPRRARGRLLVLACLGLAALSLLGPSAPTYDPWAWIIWGREIAHLDLNTRSGPSWKPLPVLFTTPFALVGDDAAPDLWLLIARAGGLLAIAMAYRLGCAARPAAPAGVIAGARAAAGRRVTSQLRARQLRGRCSSRSACGRSSATSTAAAPTRSCSASPPRCCGPRCGRSSASTGCGWCGSSRAGAWLVGVGFVALRRCRSGSLPEYWGSGDWLRAAARARQPNPDSRRVRRPPRSSRCSAARRRSSRRRCCSAALIALVRADPRRGESGRCGSRSPPPRPC